MSEEIIDLDVIKPKDRIVIVDDRKINISAISFERILDIVEKMEELNVTNASQPSTRKMLEVFGEVMGNVLKDSDPNITNNWIKEHIDGIRMVKLINDVITPLLSNMNIESGNVITDKNTKKK